MKRVRDFGQPGHRDRHRMALCECAVAVFVGPVLASEQCRSAYSLLLSVDTYVVCFSSVVGLYRATVRV